MSEHRAEEEANYLDTARDRYALRERAEAEKLQVSIAVLCPDLGRRLPADLPASLLGRILERVRAEAGGIPVVAFVNSLRLGDWHGRKQSVDAVAEHAGRVQEDFLTREELIQRIETWLGNGRPQNEVRIVDIEHGKLAPEAGDLPVEVREGDVLPASDQVENSVFHSGDSAQFSKTGQYRNYDPTGQAARACGRDLGQAVPMSVRQGVTEEVQPEESPLDEAKRLRLEAIAKIGSARGLLHMARIDLCNLEGEGYCECYEKLGEILDKDIDGLALKIRRLPDPTGIFRI